MTPRPWRDDAAWAHYELANARARALYHTDKLTMHQHGSPPHPCDRRECSWANRVWWRMRRAEQAARGRAA